MPRINAISKRDLEVAARIKKVRKIRKCTRAYLAAQIGVTTDAVKRIELGRVPLKYELARRIFTCLGINPHWAASGKDSAFRYVQLPTSIELNVPDSAIFSRVFEARLAGLFLNKEADPKLEIVLRHQRGTLAADLMKSWFRDVPDGCVGAFEKHMDKAKTDFFETCPNETPERRLHRRLQYEDFYQKQEERMIEALKAAESRQNKRKDLLDIKPGISDNERVSKKIRSLSELLAALRELTQLRGQKAALARELKVTRQAIDQWLSRKAKPSAEITFELLHWVEQQERQK